MEAVADVIAQHAVAILLGIAAAMLAMTAVLWHLIERYGPRLWSGAVSAWNALRTSTLADRLRRIPGLEPVLTHALTAGRYLGAYAILSFMAALAALAAFFELADEIGFDEELAKFDVALSRSLAGQLPRELLEVTAVITRLGDSTFLIPLGVAVTIVLLLKRRTLLAVAWAVATSGGALLNLLLKSIFERARPAHEHGLLVAEGWSFPSGHASGSMLVYGLLGYLVIRHSPRGWHLPVAMLCVTLIVFVGFSRVLLQVHYLSDVLAGYISAAAWGALSIAGLEAVRWREGQGQREP